MGGEMFYSQLKEWSVTLGTPYQCIHYFTWIYKHGRSDYQAKIYTQIKKILSESTIGNEFFCHHKNTSRIFTHQWSLI